MQLAQLGLTELTKEKETDNKSTKNESELTLEDKYNKLNEEFKKDKEDREKREQQESIKIELNEAISSFDLFKEYPDSVIGAKAEALAIQSLNPRMSIKEAMGKVVEDRQKLIKAVDSRWEEKIKNGKLLDNSQSGIARGSGGIPQIDKEKKYTYDDVKSGATARVLADLIEGAQ